MHLWWWESTQHLFFLSLFHQPKVHRTLPERRSFNGAVWLPVNQFLRSHDSYPPAVSDSPARRFPCCSRGGHWKWWPQFDQHVFFQFQLGWVKLPARCLVDHQFVEIGIFLLEKKYILGWLLTLTVWNFDSDRFEKCTTGLNDWERIMIFFTVQARHYYAMKPRLKAPNEQWKKGPWLFRVSRGLYYPGIYYN